MDKKEVIEVISKLLKFAKDEAVEKPEDKKEDKKEDVKMSEVKTKDGVVLSTPAEKWEVGVDVVIVAEDGSSKPADDNTYELEDGSKLVIEGGKVKEIQAKQEETKEEVKKEEEMSESFSAQLKERDEKFSLLEEKFNKVLEATTILTEAFNKLPMSENIDFKPTSQNEEFGRKPSSKKDKNLKEIYSVLEEIRNENKNKNK